MSSRLLQVVMCFLLLAPAATVQAAIPQIERYALIALYAATGGDGWTDNTGWNGAPGTECSWFGITCDGAGVTAIEMSGNQLAGVLPAELGNLTSLSILNLGDNQLSGPLPLQLGDLTSLTDLNLAVNQLSGPLPRELGNLTSLTNLHLGVNQLSGPLPQELGNLTSLTNLLIFTNQLSGPLPAELGALPLRIFWASGNQLSGPLPPELANLTSISSLLLGHNALYAVDSAAQGWADTYDSDWEATQTVAPENLNAPPLSNGDATVSWTPITFSALAGGYEIELASSPAGPWSLATTTPSKVESSAIVGNLPSGEWYFRARTFTEPHSSNQNTVYSGYGNVASTSVADGVVVDPTSGLMTTEAGGSDTFSIVLTSRPAADVMIGLSSANTAEGAIEPASMTFTIANWNVAQTATVTGVDDVLDDGDMGYAVITSNASSGGAGYDGLVIDDIAVTNADDDTAGVSIASNGGVETTEAGTSDTFTVTLTSKPLADVVIGLSSSDVTEGSVAPAGLTFTSADWNEVQTVTVSGLDDDVADGDQPYKIVTATAASTDPAYADLAVPDVPTTNLDDDSSGVVVSPTAGLETTEAGGSGTFTIVLTSEPLADVVIGLSSSDTAEGIVAPSGVTFTSANWAVVQTVTVTGVDDGLADGDHAYTIVTDDSLSTDPGYHHVLVSDVDVTNIDDETSASESDGDGIDNAIEDAGPNGGDGNDDGTPDSAQPGVATFPAANGNGYITLISTCELRDVVAVLKESLPRTSTVFPYALVEFRLPCANAEMTVLYHAGRTWNAETDYWKFGPETPGQELTTKWYELLGVSFDTTTVGNVTVARAQFSLTDGQLGDDTGVDGKIVDQGGPGIPAPAASIPTASTWTLLLLAALLGTVGFLKLH